jgi:recombination protein RecA
LLATTLCANAQKMGGLCIYLDPENAFNDDFAKQIGLDIDAETFWYPKPPPPTVEALFSFLFDLGHQIDSLKKSNEWPFEFVLVIWDSVAATPCKQDLETENPDPTATVGLKPRIISKNLTTFLGTAAKKDIGLVCLNQLRTNIKAQPFQDPWIAPGGNAIPFYASIRLRIAPIGKLKDKKDDEGEIIGVRTQVKVEKTRFGPPHRKAEFPIYFTHGIDDPESIIEMLEKKKGVKVINGGPKGKLIAFDGQSKEDAIPKKEFKNLYMTDSVFKDKVLDAFEKVMTRDMSDPRLNDDIEVSE